MKLLSGGFRLLSKPAREQAITAVALKGYPKTWSDASWRVSALLERLAWRFPRSV